MTTVTMDFGEDPKIRGVLHAARVSVAQRWMSLWRDPRNTPDLTPLARKTCGLMAHDRCMIRDVRGQL